MAILTEMERYEVDLWLPKFTTKIDIDLKDILSAMGMPLTFSSGADFSAMSIAPTYLRTIYKLALIKVDEEGAESEAVSGGISCLICPKPNEEKNITFHTNRPFLYLITELSTGAILFASRHDGE